MKTSLSAEYLIAWRDETDEEMTEFLGMCAWTGTISAEDRAEVEAIFLEKIRLIEALIDAKLAE